MVAIKAPINQEITVEEVETILAEAMRLKVNAEVVVVNSVAKEIAIAHVEIHVQLQTVDFQYPSVKGQPQRAEVESRRADDGS